ncbi:MAG: LytTR family DNA-binding domain-containing protein [Bacteroidota bacterium]|nr:LytTR family DNA-binding domain-containing protein [Bacteroidota bacterium]
MKTIKTFIIEDEAPARTLIKSYLQDFHNIELAGEYENGFEGARAINEYKPDLIFLDIQMPKLTGFEMLELLDHWPVIIFTTAYEQFAIKAFEMNATDYLLKPFSKDRFAQAVKKALDKINNDQKDDSDIRGLVQHKDEQIDELQRIAVRTGRKIHVIASEDIHYIESDGDYVKIHTAANSYLKEKTMKFFETHLDASRFVRIHRSYIVNVHEIDRLEQYEKESYIALLKNGNRLKVSKSGYKEVREVLNL